jgi:uncharacterized protein involved in outer membrane biogenesis
VQTTLLSIAIAIILALLSALVGPHYVDWNLHRSEIEARASRLVGLNVRIAGAVEVRLLPTPSLTLQRIEVVRPGDSGALTVRSLDIEFALGALVRGEMRASHVRLEGADIEFGLDSSGRLDWPVPTMALDPDAISIEQLNVVDSRVVLTNAVSRSRLVLERVQFTGELRSLAGPVKGNGAVTTNGHRYPYQIAAGRAGEGGGVRLRLNVDLVDLPLIADADAVISIDKGSPSFEGTLQLARPVGRDVNGIIEPWRMTTRIKGDVAAAGLEQIEFQYGPDDHRAVRLRGKANLTLGRLPRLEAELTSTQIDLDRVLELPDPVRRRPLTGIKAAIEKFVDAGQFSLPLKLNLRAENMVLAGTTLQSVRSEIRSEGNAWEVELLEFRAPGSAQVRLIGRLDADAKGLTFVGPARIEARDARAFLTWLTEPPDTVAIAAGPLRAEGRLRLSEEAIAIDRFSLDGDRMRIEEGDVSYSAPGHERPARLNAILKAADLDLDRFYALAQGVFGQSALKWPGEGDVSVVAERASVAGVEVKRADVAVRYDREAVTIERFKLDDFGGAAITLNGQIRSRTSSPQGNLTVEFNARGLDGVAALLEKIDSARAAEFRRQAERFVPAEGRAKLLVIAPAAGNGAGPVRAALTLEGSVGAYRINLQGNADDIGDSIASGNLSQVGASKLSLTARLKADDGSALIELLNIEPLVVVEKRPAQLDVNVSGTIDGEMTIVGGIAAGGLEATTTGKVRLSGDGTPTAALDVKVARANIRNPQPPAPGRPVPVLPLTVLKGQVALTNERIEFNGLEGSFAGTEVRGFLAIGRSPEQKLSGELEFGEIVLPVVIATAIGAPSESGGAARAWPSEPFDRGLLDRLNGRVTVKAGRVSLSPNLAAKNVRGVVQIEQSTLFLKDIDGSLAGGQVAGDIAFERAPDGVTLRAKVKISDADLAELIRGGPPPLSGRLTLDATLEGTGRSPIAIVGSLDGHGTFSVKGGRIRRVDPAVFDVVIRSVDQGLSTDVPRVTERIEQVLGANGLEVPQAEGAIVVAAGQARLNNLVVRSDNAELALGGSVVLADDLIDARMTLSGLGRTDGPVGIQPEIGISLKGPVDSPRRTLDVASFTNWLHLRAVEQNAKRIDLLESGRDLPPEPAVPRAPRATPPTSPFARGQRAGRNPPDSHPALPGIVRPRSLITPPLDIRPPISIR